jgi:ABC-type phosphate transport system substrate-binding protein
MTQKVTELFSGYAGKYLAVFLFYIALFIPSPPVLAEDVVVAVQKDVHASTPMSRYVLSAIFGMRLTTWPDGTAIRVFVLSDENHLNTLFCKQILHIFPHQLRTAWDRLVYSGTGQAPVVLVSEQEMRTRIANTPGAIGYLTKETLDDSVALLPVE